MPSRIHAALAALAVLASVPPDASAQTPPPDRPQYLDTASLACLERAMEPRSKAAFATLPEAIERFRQGLKPGEQFSVTTRLWDAARHFEQVFVTVSGLQGDTLVGWVNSEINFLHEFHRGNRVLVLPAAVRDWTISHSDGTEEGNLLGKMMDTLQDRLQQTPGATFCTLLAASDSSRKR